MSQTAERLIDKLQLAVFNADVWGVVELHKDDAKEIADYLRTLLGMDEISVQCKRMALTNRQEAIYRAILNAGDRPISAHEIARVSGFKTLGNVWVQKGRLQAKLRAHGVGDIDTVRGRGYRFEPAGGEG